jgi:hypothetical protein
MSNVPASWFKGVVRFFKNKLLFKNGASIEALDVDPTSSAVDANESSLGLSSVTKKLYIKDDSGSSTNWNEVQGASGDPVRLLSIQKFTSSGTYTKNADASYIIVECVGGGGAGGNAALAFSNNAQGAGGGGGEYAYKLISNESIDATETVTIGAGGVAGVNNGDGDTTSFGSHLEAVGGNGGSFGGAGGISTGGLGGSGGTSTGAIYRKGGDGGNSGTISALSAASGYYGDIGGSSYFSGNRKPQASDNAAGLQGKLYGGGGTGGHVRDSSARSGGNGGAGVVVIREYGYVE